MNLAALPLYLVGRRDAILTIARSRHAVWVGLLFVLSAGFAREYDGEDLLHEPWHVLLPLAASLGTSALLYGLCYLGALRRSPTRPPFALGYVSFLALYWMTAPLAWLYAIPWERYRSPAEAVKLNLLTLGLVSAWRVLLMIRVTKVFFRFSYLSAVMTVMLFADVVALTVLAIAPLPVISMMGGVRLTESERVLLDVACTVRIVGILSFPVWFLGYLGALAFPRKVEQVSRPVQEVERVSRPVQFEHRGKHEQTWRSVPRVSLAVWIFAIALLAAGVALLPLGQPEQQLRRQVETALLEGDVRQGITLMSRRQRTDFPPHWDPPPRIGYGEHEPDLLVLLETLDDVDAAPWVRRAFIEKLTFQHVDFYAPWVIINPLTMDNDQLRRYHDVLHQLPEGSSIAAAQRDAIEHAQNRSSDDDPASAQREVLLEALLKLAGAEQRLPQADDRPNELTTEGTK